MARHFHSSEPTDAELADQARIFKPSSHDIRFYRSGWDLDEQLDALWDLFGEVA
jgi:hypothetical protein